MATAIVTSRSDGHSKTILKVGKYRAGPRASNISAYREDIS
ncbi:MAG: hypothetical protein JWQ50_8522 [Caballeronia mineralivorans]|jgi:hypothetical protein|nr:hypothetical protein [Caballeronia mineralivorans]MEA3097782.1 hypothetical protein [Caballeronia mineralivorans]